MLREVVGLGLCLRLGLRLRLRLRRLQGEQLLLLLLVVQGLLVEQLLLHRQVGLCRARPGRALEAMSSALDRISLALHAGGTTTHRPP